MTTWLQLYSQLPNFKGKIRIAQKVFSNQTAHIVQTMQDGFLMNLSLADRMQKSMFVTRHHEPHTEVFLKKAFKKSKIFVDVGANIGYFALLAKSINPQIEVHAFEPFPKNTEKLRLNIDLNNYTQINVHEICISDSIGETQFMIPPDDECGWGRIAYREIFSDQKIERPMTTLDDFFKNKPSIDVLKIDVEGFEMKVLQGARNILKNQRPILCFEANEACLVDLGTSSKQVFDFLHSLDYKIFSLDKAPRLSEVQNPIDNYELANYLALPPEKTLP